MFFWTYFPAGQVVRTFLAAKTVAFFGELLSPFAVGPKRVEREKE
jgi:hypothetical protein